MTKIHKILFCLLFSGIFLIGGGILLTTITNSPKDTQAETLTTTFSTLTPTVYATDGTDISLPAPVRFNFQLTLTTTEDSHTITFDSLTNVYDDDYSVSGYKTVVACYIQYKLKLYYSIDDRTGSSTVEYTELLLPGKTSKSHSDVPTNFGDFKVEARIYYSPETKKSGDSTTYYTALLFNNDGGQGGPVCAQSTYTITKLGSFFRYTENSPDLETVPTKGDDVFIGYSVEDDLSLTTPLAYDSTGKCVYKLGSNAYNARVLDAVFYPKDWDYFTSSYSGTGTEDSPYIIDSGEKLAKLSVDSRGGNTFENKYIEITADLNMSGLQWHGIGSYEYPFAGTLIGNNHRIWGITSEDSAIGLFNYIGKGSVSALVIDNLKITVTSVSESSSGSGSGSWSGGSGLGGLGGSRPWIDFPRPLPPSLPMPTSLKQNSQTETANEIKQNLKIAEEEEENHYEAFGALAGYIQSGATISNIYVFNSVLQATMHMQATLSGGLGGSSTFWLITSSVLDRINYGGGIAGYSESPISNCMVHGSEIAICAKTATMCGGIAGFTTSQISACSVKDTNCLLILNYNANETDASASFAGGVAGKTSSAITDCNVTNSSVVGVKSATTGGSVYSKLDNVGYFDGENKASISSSYGKLIEYTRKENVDTAVGVGGSMTVPFLGDGVLRYSSGSELTGTKISTSGNFENWTYITGYNGGYPIQKSLYHIGGWSSNVRTYLNNNLANLD